MTTDKKKTIKLEVTGKHQIIRLKIGDDPITHSKGKAQVKLAPGKYVFRWQVRTTAGTTYGASVKQGTKTLKERTDLYALEADDVGSLDFEVTP